MHAVCGFLVKSTWLKAIKAGSFHEWLLLNVKDIKKYYSKTVKMAKGHMNHTCKNVRSTKEKSATFKTANTAKLRHKKERDVYMRVYNTLEIIYSDQTGQFSKKLQCNNQYIMAMVEIDSNFILVELMTSRKDKEMQGAYRKLMDRLKDTGVVLKKHVVKNKI